MADWEEVVISELDSEFVMTKMSIVLLLHASNKLRKGGTKCNALADKCDLVSYSLLKRAMQKGKHRVARSSTS